MLLLRLCRPFAKITKEQVLSSSYDQLASLIAHKYSNKEYNTANMVVLHEIQQQHKVIHPGDWVLDLGAAPNFYWTELALKLAENEKETHRVVSNDRMEATALRSNQLHVKGDFLEQPVRTNIALTLGDRKFDTILIDVSPPFTGRLEEDGAELNRVVFEALYFSNAFLQRGGNVVCKVLACPSSRLLEEAARLLFHEFFSFRPSLLRHNSPVQFFVMKGFAMNYELEAMKKFLTQYRGSPKNKMDVVREFQAKYKWDPVQVVRNKAKNDILGLRLEGRTERDIENMFANDPYVKVSEILKQVRMIDKAHADKDNVALKKAVNNFTEGKLHSDAHEIPSTREEWINYLQKIQTEMKQLRQKKKKKPEKQVQNLQPLRDNEVYMKDNHQTADDAPAFLYLEADLHGNYEVQHEKEYLEQEIAKLESGNPEMAKRIQRARKNIKKKASLDEVFDPNFMAEEEDEVQARMRKMSEALQGISDEEFKQQLEKEGYENELQENVGRSQRGSRDKFKNR